MERIQNCSKKRREAPVILHQQSVNEPRFLHATFCRESGIIILRQRPKTVCDTIRAIAERESCVIMGRCADFLLRHNPHCINIFISASQDACAERITKRINGLTIDDAKALAKKTNKLRAEYYNFYTDKEWGHSSSYDLCIDSSRLPEEDVINQIISYVNARLAL